VLLQIIVMLDLKFYQMDVIMFFPWWWIKGGCLYPHGTTKGVWRTWLEGVFLQTLKNRLWIETNILGMDEKIDGFVMQKGFRLRQYKINLLASMFDLNKSMLSTSHVLHRWFNNS
jgi:hypothetical protein